ncbi:MAG: hypothetical protein WBL93_08055 [Lutisporaceae bacterium]
MRKKIILLTFTAFLLIVTLITVTASNLGNIHESRHIVTNGEGVPVIITDQNEMIKQAQIHGVVIPEGKKLQKIEFCTN